MTTIKELIRKRIDAVEAERVRNEEAQLILAKQKQAKLTNELKGWIGGDAYAALMDLGAAYIQEPSVHYVALAFSIDGMVFKIIAWNDITRIYSKDIIVHLMKFDAPPVNPEDSDGFFKVGEIRCPMDLLDLLAVYVNQETL